MALISLGLAAGKAILGGKSSSSAARPQVKQSKISSSAFRSQRATTQKIPKTTPLGGYGFSGGDSSIGLLEEIAGNTRRTYKGIEG